MTWLLVFTVCVQIDAGRAECSTKLGTVKPTLYDCQRQRKPMVEYLTEATADYGDKVLFIGASCERGLDL